MKRYLTLAARARAQSHRAAASRQWAPADTATIHPGVHDVHRGRAVHRELRLHRRRLAPTSATRRTAPAPAQRPTPTAVTPARCRSARRSRSTALRAARHAGLQLVDRHAGRGRDRLARPASTTTSRWSGSTRPTSRKVNPSVPGFGGPTGIGQPRRHRLDTSTPTATRRCAAAVTQLSPKQGKVVDALRPAAGARRVYTVTPGIPGDSGSGVPQRDRRRRLGTLSTVAIAPLAGSNGVGDLAKELAYCSATAAPAASVVNGTEPFQPSLGGGRSPRAIGL